jgi:hypothetical protein
LVLYSFAGDFRNQAMKVTGAICIPEPNRLSVILKAKEGSANTAFSYVICLKAQAGNKEARMLLSLTPMVVAEIQDT